MNTSIDYLHDVHSQCIENQFITLILHFSNCMYNLVNKKKKNCEKKIHEIFTDFFTLCAML